MAEAVRSMIIWKPILRQAEEASVLFGLSQSECMRMSMAIGFSKLLHRPKPKDVEQEKASE